MNTTKILELLNKEDYLKGQEDFIYNKINDLEKEYHEESDFLKDITVSIYNESGYQRYYDIINKVRKLTTKQCWNIIRNYKDETILYEISMEDDSQLKDALEDQEKIGYVLQLMVIRIIKKELNMVI